MSSEIENKPPRKAHPIGCKCITCTRKRAADERRAIEHDLVIKQYLADLPKDRVLFILDDITMEAMKKKLPELVQKFSIGEDYTTEEHTRVINELGNTSIIKFLETL